MFSNKLDEYFTSFNIFIFLVTSSIAFFSTPRAIEAQVDLGVCGSGKYERMFIPDSWGGADFSDACKKHDRCYDTLGSSKSSCDDEFRANLRQECKNTYTSWAHAVQRRSCLEAANTYYETVKRMGGDAFRDAQKNATCNTNGRATPNGQNRGDRLVSHTEMYEGDYLLSGDGRFKLVMQGDGNLVIYKQGAAIWTSNTNGVDCTPYKLAMQSDGNLVIYGKNRPIWASDTNGQGSHPFSLVMQNDGNLVIYDPSRPTWASGTCCH